MADQEIIFAGFGGQGILSMGKFLAYAGLEEKLNVSWFPSYGPEMRGGTSNCSVIVSEDTIGSPLVTDATAVIVMNRPSLDKFERVVVPGGVLVIDTDIVNRDCERTDIDVIKIPAQSAANEIGAQKIANMILLGALIEKTKVVPMDAVLNALKHHGKEQFFELNKAALLKGASFVK